MKTNQLVPVVSQLQNNSETILKTLDNTDLEKLSGGAAYLELKAIEGESSDILDVPVTIEHGI
ncbi:MAG: hypothetical protein ACFB2W_25020 [Leptolyngbyaceae cyanobacterium]